MSEEKDFYFSDKKWLATYFEKDWFDHMSETTPDSDIFNFFGFDRSLLYSDYHTKFVGFLNQELNRLLIKPQNMFEVGSSLGRNFYELCKATPSIKNATLLEPSGFLASTFLDIFQNEKTSEFPLLWANDEIRYAPLNTKEIRDVCSQVNVEFLNQSFEQIQSPATYDLTICSNVIDQVADPLLLIDFLKRTTKPHGVLALSCSYLWKNRELDHTLKDLKNNFKEGWSVLNETNLPFSCRRNERYWMHFISHVLILRKTT
jgi:SAM-dependent methyltransferase